MARSIRQSASADHEPNGMTSLIGIDAEGSEHRFVHTRNVVRVERPDGSISEYGTESPGAWRQAVADACGWYDVRAGESFLGTIAREAGLVTFHWTHTASDPRVWCAFDSIFGGDSA